MLLGNYPGIYSKPPLYGGFPHLRESIIKSVTVLYERFVCVCRMNWTLLPIKMMRTKTLKCQVQVTVTMTQGMNSMPPSQLNTRLRNGA